MSKGTYKRRQYIVDTQFQYRLMSKFAILTACVVIGSLAFLVLVYYKYGDIQVSVFQPLPFDMFDGMKDDEGASSYSLLYLLWPVLAICLVGTIIFTFFYSLIVSHRMAGPIFRMRNLLKEMAKGDISRPVSNLRKKDDFKHLFADINEVNEYMRLQVKELQLACRKLGEDGTREQHLKRIKEIASSFKTEIE